MNKYIFLRCIWVSLIMSLVLPIVTTEVFMAVHEVDERPDYTAISEAKENGTFKVERATIYSRKITGIERITHRFTDWFSFVTYLGNIAQWFVILLVATLIAASGRPQPDGS